MVLYGESEEGLKAMVGQFVLICKRKGLIVNAGKSRVMVLNGKERLESEVYLDGVHLEHVL